MLTVNWGGGRQGQLGNIDELGLNVRLLGHFGCDKPGGMNTHPAHSRRAQDYRDKQGPGCLHVVTLSERQSNRLT